MDIQRSQLHVKARCPTCRVRSHRAATHLPAGIEGVRTHASISLLRVSAGVLLSHQQRRLVLHGVLSKLEKRMKLESRRIGPAWAVSYFADQLTL